MKWRRPTYLPTCPPASATLPMHTTEQLNPTKLSLKLCVHTQTLTYTHTHACSYPHLLALTLIIHPSTMYSRTHSQFMHTIVHHSQCMHAWMHACIHQSRMHPSSVHHSELVYSPPIHLSIIHAHIYTHHPDVSHHPRMRPPFMHAFTHTPIMVTNTVLGACHLRWPYLFFCFRCNMFSVWTSSLLASSSGVQWLSSHRNSSERVCICVRACVCSIKLWFFLWCVPECANAVHNNKIFRV